MSVPTIIYKYYALIRKMYCEMPGAGSIALSRVKWKVLQFFAHANNSLGMFDFKIKTPRHTMLATLCKISNLYMV